MKVPSGSSTAASPVPTPEKFSGHQVRRKRIIAGVVALSVISFLGLMALSYWGSV